MEEGILWGIDLGGTKIEGVVLDQYNDNKVLYRERIPTEASKGYPHILNQVKKLVDSMVAHHGCRPTRLGIGTPGTMNRHSGLMKNCNATAINGQPMQKDLTNLLGIEVKMANDANCFALAEAKLGVVKHHYPDAQVVFGVILGTGVGGGLVINGHIINGHHGIGGEWGHNLLSGMEGRPCFCGKEGDNESILSGPSLEWYYHQKTGTQKPLKEIIERARAKTDSVAIDTLDRLTDGFARAISVVINIVDPDVIVIGGGVGNIDEIYTTGASRIPAYVFNHEFQAPIVKPALGDSAGVFGAAFLIEE
ncbi:sugar kinase [Reichenbachiella sp. 5M10]|uniref:ROK family protein n=1 Tax=Reichenbachiella sp. 5M10 TaxID=1889772 RepID=UPI000C15FABA|nr:ROK family protein [Reichenbachiella sp. 5M10]PIB34924.1 sugar kinase [Reichenbachiella sp. 5M10]